MDIKSKNFSHLLITKIAVFITVIACFTGAITAFINVAVLNNDDFNIVFERNYFESRSYAGESEDIVNNLVWLIDKYKSEEHILKGGTITEDEMMNQEERLYSQFRNNLRSFDPELGQAKNYEKFKEEYAGKIAEAKDNLIKSDMREYNRLLQRLKEYKDIIYYASNGVNVFTNSQDVKKEYFKSYPSYMIFENYEREIYPKEFEANKHINWITGEINRLDQESSVIYIAFADGFYWPRITDWKQDKVVATNSLYWFAGFLLCLMLSFIYLVILVGRKSFRDKELHFNMVDRIYNDINIGLCILLIAFWVVLMEGMNIRNLHWTVYVITIPIATAGLALVLSLMKHIKNRTFLRHTLTFTIFHRIFRFVGDVYESGGVGVKTVLIVIGYPVLVALTFFIFPVTIGAAAWVAFKKVKAFNAIKEGVERIKSGDIHHTIEVDGKGEFSKLAANINSIADGLKNAVDSELKSERLKTELITNVSHDIRTPLTSIITYVDLLKKEKDPSKIEQYIEVLDQKSQRLKVLTDDLFEAAKASSGNIPVNFDRIDIVSLITQGLGELNDKVEASELEFKINHPNHTVYVTADGRLLWRAIENLLSNIFKYALKGSRVYINIEDLDSEIMLAIKNISAYELNISADELMERFKRGDESRSSQGSGLGLSIAKSLVDIQRGRFSIQVDGDLFKAMIYMPKYKKSNE